MILDTSYIVALDEEDPDAQQLARKHRTAGVPQRLPTMVLFELFFGVGAGSDAFTNARKYEELVGNLPIVDVTGNVARRAGVIAGLHVRSDTKPDLGTRDAVIAATGLVYAEPVVTADVDDFGSVDGLETVTWERGE